MVWRNRIAPSATLGIGLSRLAFKATTWRADRASLIAVFMLIAFYVSMRWLGLLPRPVFDYNAFTLLSYVPAFLAVASIIVVFSSGEIQPREIRQSFVQANLLTALSFILVLSVEAVFAPGYWVVPVFTLAIWLLLDLSIRFGSAAVTAAIISVQTIIALTSADLLSSVEASNLAVVIGSGTMVIPIFIMIYLRSVEKQRQALEVAGIRQSRFIAHMGHELGQPLNATRLLVSSLGATSLSAEQYAVVERVGQSIDGLASLFRSMLDVSMLDSNTILVKSERIDLGQLLADLTVENEDAAHRSGVELRYVRSSRIVVSDRALLATMIQNLIANAIRHAPRSKALLGVRLRNQQISVEVHDLGPGILPERMPRVFEEFYRGSHSTSGAGLGLSIVHRLAKILGAEVKLASRLGRGSSASIDGLNLESH